MNSPNEKSSDVEGSERSTAVAAEKAPNLPNVTDSTEASLSKGDDPQSGAEDVEKKKKKNEGSFGDYLRIFKYCDRLDWILYSIAFLGCIASGATLPLMTLIFGQFTTKFNTFATGQLSPQDFKKSVNHAVLWFVYLFAARLVISYVSNVCISIAAVRTTRAIRKAFLESTLRQEVWYYDQQSNGSTASQVTTNGNRINQGIAEKLGSAVQAMSLFFSAFIVALAVQWKLSLITMTVIPAIFLVVAVCIAIDAVLEGRIVPIYSRASVIAQEAISSIKTVHAFWAQDKMVDKYDELLAEAHRIANKKSANMGILYSVQYFLTLAATALAFWEGFRLYLSGEVPNVGTVFTVVLSVTIGATAIGSFAPQIQSLTNASSAAAELFSVIDKESLLDPLSSAGLQPPSCTGEIEIRDLCFAYPSRPAAQVLHSVNLSIPAGKTTALVGASGCGKSTIVGLLERWYEPTSGQILLDGNEISEYNTKWLRTSIRLIQQEPVLFRGSIFANIARGFVGSQADLSHEAQMELVVEACKAANAHDFIQDLPQGYHTQVGERASMLSGGQRQRLAIARSIISNPKVLLLDEATSALDPRAEGIVQNALNRVSVNKTTLVIAHKLATVKAADNIAVMAYGKIVEQGTHNDLIERNGQYASLVRAQDLGAAEKREADFAQEEDGDGELEKRVTLQSTKTDGAQDSISAELKYLSSGTLNYSLLRCLYIMVMEQRGVTWCFIFSTLGCLTGGGTYPAQAIVYSHLINVFTLQGQAARQEADFYALMFFVIALVNLFGYFAVGYGTNIIAQTATHRYRREMMQQIMMLDQDFFDRPENSSGALASKLSSIPNAMQELLSGNIFLMLIVVVNIVSSSILAIAYGWKLGLVVVFGGLPLLLGSGWAKIRLDQRLDAQAGERFADSAGLATEAVTSIRTVASLTLETQIMKEYSDVLDNITSRATRSFLVTMVGYALSQSLEFLVMALGFWYGSRLIASGEYAVEQFFVIFVAVIFGGQAAAQFFGYSTSITKGQVAANYILWLRTLKASIGENKQNEHNGPSGDGPIGVEDLEFRYKQRDASRVLRGIDLKIEAGSYVACVGPSGCGKTTLISLLERFYDPLKGRITLNHDDISKMSPRLYRDYMSLVQQEPTLYQGSVRENICLGLRSQPSDEEILDACRQANALEFVSSLPEGLNTPCGTKGLQFSGGQRQRIAIARALIRNPRLLLLDEATSALDTQSERIVQQTLDQAASSRTTVAVAHRLSTIKHADVIFVFASGKIVEVGTHEELQRLKGRYYEMCIAQSLDRA